MVLETLTKKRKITLTKALGAAPTEKSKQNAIINDLPSVDEFVNQKKIRPATPKSTFGLLGFSEDATDPITGILLQQKVNEDDLRAIADNEIFGTLQIDTPTDGGIQTKTVQVTREFVNTLDQEKIATMSAEQKAELERIIAKIGFKNNKQPVHQLTHDQVIDPAGKQDVKKTVGKGSGMRRFVDDINATIRGKFAGFGVIKDQADAKKQNLLQQFSINKEVPLPAIGTGEIQKTDASFGENAAKVQTPEVDLDLPFRGRGNFA